MSKAIKANTNLIISCTCNTTLNKSSILLIYILSKIWYAIDIELLLLITILLNTRLGLAKLVQCNIAYFCG